MNVDFGIGRYSLETFYNYACACYYVIDVSAAVFSKVVGANHYECLLGLSNSNGLNVVNCLVYECTPYAAVYYVVVGTECLPPFVHVGDTVSNEDNILVLDRKHFEHIISVVAERVLSR